MVDVTAAGSPRPPFLRPQIRDSVTGQDRCADPGQVGGCAARPAPPVHCSPPRRPRPAAPGAATRRMNYNARDKLWLRYRARAFSGEVGTGSPQKMRPLKDNWSEILFHWNGVRSKARFVAGKPDQECAHSIRATPASHGRCAGVIRIRGNADVAEPVDATDLKSVEGNLVRVRVPPSAPIKTMAYIATLADRRRSLQDVSA